MSFSFRSLFGYFRCDDSDTGAWGEGLAADFLRKKHYGILARNWRSPHDHRLELDLVCRDHELIVFVEVKTRSAASLQRGYQAVNRRKRRALLLAVRAYLSALPIRQRPLGLRFDIVEVTHYGRHAVPEVLHFENAPLFPKRFVP